MRRKEFRMCGAFLRTCCLGAAILLADSCRKQEDMADLLPTVRLALQDTTSVYYGHFGSYPGKLADLPVGIFDDGPGGLSVLKTFLEADLFDNITGEPVPDGIADFGGERFVYYADVANAPYAGYPDAGAVGLLRDLVVQDALFLTGDTFFNMAVDEKPYGQKDRAKVLVCANRAASAFGLSDVDDLLSRSGVPLKVFGVVDAAVKAYLDRLPADREGVVGVLADPETVSSGVYEQTVRKLATERGQRSLIRIYHQPVRALSDWSEEADSLEMPVLGKKEGQIDLTLLDRYRFDFSAGAMVYRRGENGYYRELQINSMSNLARFQLVSLIEKYRKNPSDEPLQAVIVACPHTARVMDTLKKVIVELRQYKRNGYYLYRDLIAPDFRFIDPAQEAARACYAWLRQERTLALRPVPGEVEMYLSVPAYGLASENLTQEGDFTETFKYGRLPADGHPAARQVPFSYRYLEEMGWSRAEAVAPLAFRMIQNTLY